MLNEQLELLDSKTTRLQPRKSHSRRTGTGANLCHDPENPIPALGCQHCPDLSVCGGLRPTTAFYDCLQFCCGSEATCDRVCRNNPDFVSRVREVGTFELNGLKRPKRVEPPSLPAIVPIIYHGSGRRARFRSNWIAIPLYTMFDRNGAPKFEKRHELDAHFAIDSKAKIVLTGTAKDKPIERWWALGASKREAVIKSSIELGAETITTPNYSLFTDRPRWDDLHSMKRIAIVHQEIQSCGVVAALHVNGRTEHDFERWASFLAERPEITHLAYEFTTGTRTVDRLPKHTAWLRNLASAVPHKLSIVVRGGANTAGLLRDSFEQVTTLEATAFMKTIKRQKAHSVGSSLTWRQSPTDPGAALDSLLEDNYAAVRSNIGFTR